MKLTVTEKAIEKLISAKESDGLSDAFFIRVSVKGGGCSGFVNELAFDNELDEEDITFELSMNDKRILVASDVFSAMYLDDVILDYVMEDFQEGFKFSGGSANRRHCACGSSFTE